MKDKDHFVQVGGARLGAMNVSFPFAKLSVYRNGLFISCLGETYTFPKTRVLALSEYRGLFSVGLHVDHNVPAYPRFVVFWIGTFFKKSHFASLRERLQGFQYDVSE